jgi:hypothetical protein
MSVRQSSARVGVRTRIEARETSALALREEVRRAERLCKEEEAACSDVESLDDPDYVDGESSSDDGSYESDFIDDSEVDVAETQRALEVVRRRGGRTR